MLQLLWASITSPLTSVWTVTLRKVRVSLHQEMSWPEGGAPIVAFVLGMASAFLFKEPESSVDARRINLWHGDVIVWGPAGTA